MIAVFVRPNQPDYKNGEWNHHGYVVALVRCKSRKELEKVNQKLNDWKGGLPEPFSHPYQWYGGQLELVAVLPGNKAELYSGMPGFKRTETKISIGDNRYVGLYDASELLD